MAYTAADLITIERAIAECTRSVSFSDGRRVEYDSMEERMKARSDIAAALAKGSSRPTVRRIQIYTTKGF